MTSAASIRRLCDHEHVLLVDDRGDAFAQQRVVVDAEHADLRSFVHRSFSIRPSRRAVAPYRRHLDANPRRIGARLKVWSSASAGTELELSVPGHVAFTQERSHHRGLAGTS